MKNAEGKVVPMSGTSFNAAVAIEAIPDPRDPSILGDYDIQGPAMLGVIRVEAEGTQGFWERHDGGDELLVVIAGRFTMTLRPGNAPERRHELEPGDVLLIPKGVAHSAKLHTPEIRLLFLTPRDGNKDWSEDPAGRKRH